MEKASRRGFLGALAVTGATFGTTSGNAATEKLELNAIKKDTDFACLYHCDFGPRPLFADAQ
jgi:hypothetical protein